MPSIINASSSGSGGLVQTADASGVLQLQSNGTVALSTSGANVVLGGQISVVGGDGSIQRNGGNTWIMLSSNTGYNSNGVHLKLDSSTSAGAFNFFSVGTQILGMSGTGRTLVLQGGTDSAGTGITFPASQNASSDPNTLDDYEEGTWTPSVPGVSLANVLGQYVKIGNVVTYWGAFSYSSGTCTSPRVNGLPFSTNSSNRSPVGISQADDVSWGSGATMLVGFASGTGIDFFGNVNNAPYVSITASQFVKSGTFIEFGGSYTIY